MKKLVGFILFLAGSAGLIYIYLVQAKVLGANTIPFMSQIFQSRNDILIGIAVAVGLLLVGFLLMGRIMTGILFVILGISGIIFPILTRFKVLAIPNNKILIWFLNDNFYVTILLSVVLLVLGYVILSGRRRKREEPVSAPAKREKRTTTKSDGVSGAGNIVVNINTSKNKHRSK